MTSHHDLVSTGSGEGAPRLRAVENGSEPGVIGSGERRD
jgi:hypothetical protein